MDIFLQLNRAHGITVIVVTHSDEVAGFASRIITFRDGRILSDTRGSISLEVRVNAANSHVPVEVSP
jgi:ABC-type lipoprotein export system ATPase subunit